MNVGPPMTHVVVAGGGLVAWSAAAALKRNIPSLLVTVVSCPVPADALADRMVSTLPSIVGFHEDLGLGEGDTIYRAKSGLRVGTLFEGWADGLPSYVHAYGTHGFGIEGIPFHQLWLRAQANGGIEQFDRYSAAAELGRLGRIGSDLTSMKPKPEVGYGLHLTIEHYHALVRDYALYLGALERSCRKLEPKLREESGFVDALILDDAHSIAADLYVDCTGPAASIRGKLGDGFHDWSAYLPCDRLIDVDVKPDGDATMLDRASATASGWQWASSSPGRSSRGRVYSSAHSNRDDVLREIGGSAAEVTEARISAGRWREPWNRNCVAIGDSAVRLEPLEWTNLHLAHSQIDRLISMMPGRDCASVELGEYNRQCSVEADRVRDFVCMHYITARRDDPFWKEAAAIAPPTSLAHTLALFAERGRLPYYEEETFSRESWTAVLLGQGFNPRRTDPLADGLPLNRVRLELDRYAERIRDLVASQPMYADYISNLAQESA